MLFIFAWSSVGFNLQRVYNPVMKSLFTFNDAEAHLNKLTKPLINPAIDFVQARLLGRQYAVQAKKHTALKCYMSLLLITMITTLFIAIG